MRRSCLTTCISLAALFAALLLASGSGATPIGPSCGTCQGSIYEVTYSGSPISTDPTPQTGAPNGTETFRITYTIDTSGYNGTGTNINTVAVKVSSSFVDATLVDAPLPDGSPGGVANWVEMFGGLNAAGCSGSGSGYDCVRVAAIANAPIVPGGTYVWVFDIEVPTGTLFTGTGESSVKARYGDATHLKVGDLVSEPITLEVPEPATAGLLAAAALFGLVRRRQR